MPYPCSRLRRAAPLLLAIAALLCAPAQADSPLRLPSLPSLARPDEATARRGLAAYARARSAWAKRRYRASLVAAEEAYRAVPNASTALIVATVLGALERPCEALDYLLLASDLDVSPDEAAAVSAGLAREALACAPGHGWVTVELQPGNATASIDGQAVPARRTVGLPAGSHQLAVVAAGHEPRTQAVQVEAGAGASFRVELVEARAVAGVVVGSTVPKPAASAGERTGDVSHAGPQGDTAAHGSTAAGQGADAGPSGLPLGADDQTGTARPHNTLGWSLTCGGLAAVALGGVLYGLALDQVSVVTTLSSELGSQSEYNEVAERIRALEISAWTVGGAGLGVLIGGVVLLALDVETTVWVAPAPGGAQLGLSGSF